MKRHDTSPQGLEKIIPSRIVDHNEDMVGMIAFAFKFSDQSENATDGAGMVLVSEMIK